MSGQSAALSLKEARAMQCRVQASGSHAETHGGGSKKTPHGKTKKNEKAEEMMEKE